MEKYKMIGGWEITATDSEDLTNKLNQGSLFGFRQNVGQFMVETALACNLYNGSEIRFSNSDEFIKDLISTGILERIEND